MHQGDQASEPILIGFSGLYLKVDENHRFARPILFKLAVAKTAPGHLPGSRRVGTDVFRASRLGILYSLNKNRRQRAAASVK
jgi:hypothetical protein